MTDMELSFSCIKGMQSQQNYYDKWKSIKTAYADKLDKGQLLGDKAYTPHDYSRHCINIYNNLSLIIPEVNYAEKLNVEDLFILNVAVILHDIMMVFDPLVRDEHGKAASDEILKSIYGLSFDEVSTIIETNTESKAIYQCLNKSVGKMGFLSELLTPNEAVCIANVILGHSDIKTKTGKISTIDMLPNEDYFIRGFCGKDINVRVLASLLRLADEMDITSNRIQGTDFNKYKINEDSNVHWRKLKLFSNVKLSDKKDTILLYVDEQEFKVSDDKENEILLIREVRNKVKTELDMVFSKGIYSGLTDWAITKVEIKASQEILNMLLEKDSNPLETVNNLEKKNIIPLKNIANHNIADSNNKKNILIDEALKQDIIKWVIKDKIILDGHFEINSNKFARDWIDVKKLLSNKDYLRKITDNFADKIIKTNSKYLIIGIDVEGLILSSVISYKTGCPFSYIISDKNKPDYTKKEININVKKGDKIILITDVVVNADTVKGVIQDLVNSFKIDEEDITYIFSIFYRRKCGDSECNMHCEIKETEIPENIIKKLYVLNDEIDIEICEKSENKCLLRKYNLIRHSNKPI